MNKKYEYRVMRQKVLQTTKLEEKGNNETE